MADLYNNWAELSAATVEGTDWNILTNDPPGTSWISLAIHGGGIEAGSGEVAESVAAGGLMKYYQFDAISTGLHITSTHYDEPTALSMVGASGYCLSFHGLQGDTGVATTALGGADPVLVERVRACLVAAGFSVTQAPSEVAGTDPDNICNKTARKVGVQLEMSRALRESFFTDFTRTGRKTQPRTQAFYDYVAAVRKAFTGYGVVASNSVNSSRYALIPAPSANQDITASVATGALATGGGHFPALVTRYQDNSNLYLCRVEFSTTQQVILTIRRRVSGTETFLVQKTTSWTHVPFSRFFLRFAVDGATLTAKVWPDGQREPDAWTLTTTDTSLVTAGQMGMRTILSSANTNTLPLLTYWGDFSDNSGTQRMSVTRSVNGVTKAQTAGTPVTIANPPIVSL